MMSYAYESNRTLIDRRRFIGIGGGVFFTASLAGIGLFSSSAFAVPSSAEKQAEADAMQRKLEEWQNQLDAYSNDYYTALDAHDIAIDAMNEAQGRIDAAIARQNELQNQLEMRARAMYKQGPLTFLDVVFGAHSFTEFTSSWDVLNDINDRDAELIVEFKQARQDAETAKNEYSTQELIAKQKLDEAEAVKQQAEALMATYETELSNLNAEVAELLRQEQEAEERRRAEEEARNKDQPGESENYAPYDGEKYGSIVDYALSRLGCPYVWGATGPNSFDCSGLTSWCYAKMGISIPRGGNLQYEKAPIKLPVAEAKPGDILWKYNHVGICIGDGLFVHAPNPSTVVKINSIAGYGWQGAARW